jgi:hypothetical protein
MIFQGQKGSFHRTQAGSNRTGVTTQLTSFGARKCPVLPPPSRETGHFQPFFPLELAPHCLRGLGRKKVKM